jgi:hypothetical protein
MNRSRMRPGGGWRHVAGPVWEHAGGARVHIAGLVKLQDGRYLHANKWPECRDAERLIRVNGGNRKRGLMAWAMAHNELSSPAAEGSPSGARG